MHKRGLLAIVKKMTVHLHVFCHKLSFHWTVAIKILFDRRGQSYLEIANAHVTIYATGQITECATLKRCKNYLTPSLDLCPMYLCTIKINKFNYRLQNISIDWKLIRLIICVNVACCMSQTNRQKNFISLQIIITNCNLRGDNILLSNNY